MVIGGTGLYLKALLQGFNHPRLTPVEISRLATAGFSKNSWLLILTAQREKTAAGSSVVGDFELTGQPASMQHKNTPGAEIIK